MKELTFIYISSQKEIREGVLGELTNMFYYYKKETKQTNTTQLVLLVKSNICLLLLILFLKKAFILQIKKTSLL